MYYANRSLTTAESNYSTMEREVLGLIYIITKFRHYLLGRKFTFHVDHATLLYIANKSTLTGNLPDGPYSYRSLPSTLSIDLAPNMCWVIACHASNWTPKLQFSMTCQMWQS